MEINSANAKKIDTYIKDFRDCQLEYPERVPIQDKMQNLPVYRLPLDYLFYNVANGRFASEYLALKKQLGRDLNSEVEADAEKIEEMLLDQNKPKTEWLKNKLKEDGQNEPGIITHDGYVINGNRRKSVLTILAKEDSKFGYLNVGRLPENVTESDVYKIELGKQMAREQKLDYGPIDQLLKIKHGIDSGLNEEQIAKTIGFSVEEIKEKIERLSLIDDYLKFIGEPENYKAVGNVNEHMIDLQKYLFSKNIKRKNQFSPLDLLKIQEIAFSAIKGGIAHLEIRKIPKLFKNEKIKPVFLKAQQHAKTDHTKTLEIIDVCTTRLKAEQDKDKPGKLLEAILGNIDALDLTSSELKKDEYKTQIKKILDFQDELRKLVK